MVNPVNPQVGTSTHSVEVVQPAIRSLVELGNGVGGVRISSTDRATTRQKLLDALLASKARSLSL